MSSRNGRPPHLLVVNHFGLAPDMGGGTRHVEIGRELVRHGWDVSIAASDFHVLQREYLRRESGDDRSTIDESVDGVRFRWLWASPYDTNDARRVGNWITFARSVLRSDWRSARPDVVLGSSPHLLAALAARIVAWRMRTPFILEIRDLWPESLAVGGRRRGAGYWAMWVLARFLYRSADRIIVLARGVGQYLQRLGVPEKKIVFIPNGADVSSFAETRRSAGGRLRLAYAGAHGPANGLESVLDAAELLRQEARVSFVLIGDGPSKGELRESTAQRGLDNVTFADPIGKAAMPRFLAECDAGLMILRELPLFSFGVSPNKLFDYWGAGLPVINNVPGEVAGWVREADGGIQAADGTGRALASAIEKLLALSPEERYAMGERGRAWVRREHDRPVLAARMESVLRSLVPGVA